MYIVSFLPCYKTTLDIYYNCSINSNIHDDCKIELQMSSLDII